MLRLRLGLSFGLLVFGLSFSSCRRSPLRHLFTLISGPEANECEQVAKRRTSARRERQTKNQQTERQSQPKSEHEESYVEPAILDPEKTTLSPSNDLGKLLQLCRVRPAVFRN